MTDLQPSPADSLAASLEKPADVSNVASDVAKEQLKTGIAAGTVNLQTALAAADAALNPTGDEKVFNVYYCNRQSMHMCLPNGRKLAFTNRQHITDVSEVIRFLDGEIERGNRAIFIDPEKLTMTSADMNPMAAIENALRKKILAEITAEQEAAKPREMGNTAVTQNAGPGAMSTAALSKLAADSNAGKK